MAKSPVIPLRPKDYISSLSPNEQVCLTWFVISRCTRKEAFLRFARPDLALSSSSPSVDNHVKEFFASKEAKEYIEAYEKTLDGFLHPVQDAPAEPKGNIEERKARAKTKLVEFAMSLADNIENAGDPEFVLKIADKAGLLDIEEKVEEQPRRYLPVTCEGCEYRKFVEENCERIEDGTNFEGEDDIII